jgi:hypothetical protein
MPKSMISNENIQNNTIKNSEYGVEFTSQNTKQLNAEELAEILLKIPFIIKSIEL